MRTRTEKDPMGKKQVPSDALFGIHTQRAYENFQISNLTLPLPLFHAIAQIKIATAQANYELGFLDKKRTSLIVRAAKEVVQGKHDEHFIIDQFQAGMATPTHMNVNEVIANRALDLANKRRGQYHFIHPNDHVNMGQSTNNVIPTALKITALDQLDLLFGELKLLEKLLNEKARAFNKIVKSGRTHLQDAVPITLGQEFRSYAVAIKKNRDRLNQNIEPLLELNVGKNAIGTGINTHPSFTRKIIKHLKKIKNRKFKESQTPIYATANTTPFYALSTNLRLLATDLTKLANDLRLLSSGPNTGLNEISLPAVEPGSSIMPGKVNPSIAEMLNMVSFQVMGNDEAIALASQAGQLELNVMTPLIAKNLMESLIILSNAIKTFNKKCVKGIKANEKTCRHYFENSAGLATLLNPYVGYDAAAEVVKESLKTGQTFLEILKERKLLPKKDLQELVKNAHKPNRKK